MKSKIKFWVFLGSLLFFVAAFFGLLTTQGPLAPVKVQLGKVARADLTPSVFGIGIVDARLAYSVGPIAAGRVLRVLVDQGETVKAGQLLAEMDPVDLDRRVQASRSVSARVRQTAQVAEAQVTEAASRARIAGMNRDRDLELFRQQGISKQSLDNSLGEAERAEAALLAAKANALAAKQDIDRADAEGQGSDALRENTKLVSPVDGVVVSREAEPGTTVVAGQAVFRLVEPKTLWVRARIDQARAHGVQVGQTAKIVLRSAPETPFAGQVARMEIQSDPVTEERIVNVSFVDPPAQLFLGELAEVTISQPKELAVLLIPEAAVSREGGQTGVWQKESGRARFKPVRLGSRGEKGLIRILSGLNESDRVIVYSSAQLLPGIRIREERDDPK